MKKYDFVTSTVDKEFSTYVTVFKETPAVRGELTITRLSKALDRRSNPKILRTTTFHFSKNGFWTLDLRDAIRHALDGLKNDKIDQIKLIGLPSVSLYQFNLPEFCREGEYLTWQPSDFRKLLSVVREALSD